MIIARLDFGQENKPRHAGADTGFQTRGLRYGPSEAFPCWGPGTSSAGKCLKLRSSEMVSPSGILRPSQRVRISPSFFLIQGCPEDPISAPETVHLSPN